MGAALGFVPEPVGGFCLNLAGPARVPCGRGAGQLGASPKDAGGGRLWGRWGLGLAGGEPSGRGRRGEGRFPLARRRRERRRRCPFPGGAVEGACLGEARPERVPRFGTRTLVGGAPLRSLRAPLPSPERLPAAEGFLPGDASLCLCLEERVGLGLLLHPHGFGGREA